MLFFIYSQINLTNLVTMRTIAILLCLLFCLPTHAKKMDENNQIPQKDISIRFNFGIASANQEGTGESLWYSNPKKSSRGFQYGPQIRN